MRHEIYIMLDSYSLEEQLLQEDEEEEDSSFKLFVFLCIVSSGSFWLFTPLLDESRICTMT
jgi:hypothetical protein